MQIPTRAPMERTIRQPRFRQNTSKPDASIITVALTRQPRDALHDICSHTAIFCWEMFLVLGRMPFDPNDFLNQEINYKEMENLTGASQLKRAKLSPCMLLWSKVEGKDGRQSRRRGKLFATGLSLLLQKALRSQPSIGLYLAFYTHWVCLAYA